MLEGVLLERKLDLLFLMLGLRLVCDQSMLKLLRLFVSNLQRDQTTMETLALGGQLRDVDTRDVLEHQVQPSGFDLQA